jgi:hypothetical protein
MPGAVCTVDIRPLNISSLAKDAFILFVGKRGSGKTNWSRSFLDRLPDRNEGIFVVMGGSARVRVEWSRFVHRLYVVEPSVQYLERLTSIQNKHVEKYAKNGIPFPPELHVTLILDDIGPVSEIMKSQILAWLAANGRHIELRMLILLQHLTKQCPTEVRTQAEVVFVHATGNRKLISVLHEEYAGCCEIRIFRSILGALTENYGVLAIDNRKNALKVEECCFSAKYDIKQEIAPFGSVVMRQYADRHHLDMDASGNLSVTNQTVRALLDEDASGPDAYHLDAPLLKDVLDTRRVYTDRIGQVVIRRVAADLG